MPPPWIIEAVDIFKEGYLRFSACAPATPPDQFGFQRFEEHLHDSTTRAITFTAHRALKALLAQIDCHAQRTDCQVLLHTIADSPTDDTPGIWVQDHSQIEPSLTGPDVRDVAGSFLVRRAC